MTLPYEHPRWRQVIGEALHPGGECLSRRLLSLCAFPPGSRVLDAGCGAGATLGLLTEGGFDAVGLDRADDLLLHARYRGPVVKGDLRQLPFKDGSFDGAICECVLTQQEDLSQVLIELARVLKRGGVLGVTDIFATNHIDCGRDFRVKDGSCINGARPASEMDEAFKAHGFEIPFFEAHPKLLRDCTAQLVWAGVIEAPPKMCCSLSYGLWLCRKASSQGMAEG